MYKGFRAHDLLRIGEDTIRRLEVPEALRDFLRTAPFVVVRRDGCPDGRIPVGIRGRRRSERFPVWLSPDEVLEVLTPEALVASEKCVGAAEAPLRALAQLRERACGRMSFEWGVIGATGFTLASGVCVLLESSDLDLLVRCPTPTARTEFDAWSAWLAELPCRADTQIETPLGGFALNEFLSSPRVLLKTVGGPILTTNPWRPE